MATEPTERPARPGETCNCGKPAVIVYITTDHGDVPYCGVPHTTPAIPFNITEAGDVRPASADDRFTWDMAVEIFDVLEGYGYRKASDEAGGRAVTALMKLIEAYEGRS